MGYFILNHPVDKTAVIRTLKLDSK